MAERDDPRVRTQSGTVRGLWTTDGAKFLGVPYAAAPIGPHRFTAPAPALPWTGDRDASRPGPTPQRRPLAPVTTIPEPSVPGDETLNLSIYTPAPGAPNRRLPVLVWIHGGGFVGGSPASPWYDGSSFSRDGVVTVVVAYRLGFDGFGWLADAPLNRGLLDQIAALEWVRDNIAPFGGDPDAVTIAGQSAGGSSVLALLTSPRAQPLFRAAICHSGVGRTQYAAEAERLGRELANDAAVEPTRAGWSALSEDEILDLQARFGMQPPPESVDPTSFAEECLFADPELAFGPTIDGELVLAPVEEALAAGVGAAKRLLIGATAHEFSAVLARAGTSLGDLDVRATLTAAGLSADAAEAHVQAYPELADPVLLLGQLLTEQMFRLPLMRWVRARIDGGAANRTWLYDFRRPSSPLGLASHCTELPFAWDLLGADGVARSIGDNPPQPLADLMHHSWVRFLRDGDPGWSIAGTGVGMVFAEDSGERLLLDAERRLAGAIDAVRDRQDPSAADRSVAPAEPVPLDVSYPTLEATL